MGVQDPFSGLSEFFPGFLYIFEEGDDPAFRFISDSVSEIFGVSREQALENPNHCWMKIAPEDGPHVKETQAAARESLGIWDQQFRIMHPDRGDIWVHAHATPQMVEQDGSTFARWYGLIFEVGDQVLDDAKLKQAHNALVQAQDELEFNSLHDALTDLPNRRALDQHLEEIAFPKQASDGHISVLHIGLDRFQQINNTLGHETGDAVLLHMARTLRKLVRQIDFVARIAGDEFLIVMKESAGEDRASIIAGQIVEEARKPIIYMGRSCRFGASVGVARSDLATTPRRLLVNADIALHRAKVRGRERTEHFTPALRSEMEKHKKTADEILESLERQDFIPFYQPQFCAHTFDLIGVEALARWRHPNGELMSPIAFLDVASDLNVVSKIDSMIMARAISDYHRWRALGVAPGKVSVNVSWGRLVDPELLDNLKRLKFHPGLLHFELLETVFLDELDDEVTERLQALEDLGIEIEVDDFGSGHASLLGLIKLNPKWLKIDRQLVSPMLSDIKKQRLVGSIIEIGHSFGIKVLAEGTESVEHARQLADLGCDALQGAALGLPMSFDQFVEFAAEEEWRQLLDPAA